MLGRIKAGAFEMRTHKRITRRTVKRSPQDVWILKHSMQGASRGLLSRSNARRMARRPGFEPGMPACQTNALTTEPPRIYARLKGHRSPIDPESLKGEMCQICTATANPLPHTQLLDTDGMPVYGGG